MLKRTALYDFHVGAHAKMVDYAGWEMPLLYRGISEEHLQTRRSGSIFDVSHMGRFHFKGKDAQRLLSKAVTRKLDDQVVGQSRYSLVCNEAGGILDDVIVSRDTDHWLLVCNAANRQKLWEHFGKLRLGFDVDLSDQTEATVMVAAQGPKVIDRLGGVLPIDAKALKRYHFETSNYMMLVKFTAFRSGYTGEDGLELILPASVASMAMKFVGSALNKEEGTILPAGLGARDTLRLEAGMPLYGHELTEETDPISAGLGWAVDVTKDFVGVAPIREVKQNGPKRKLVGLELEGRRIARQDTPVLRDGKPVGVVTSGTFGPTVQKSIAMAYVDAATANVGTVLACDLKGTANSAVVVKLPFYKRA